VTHDGSALDSHRVGRGCSDRSRSTAVSSEVACRRPVLEPVLTKRGAARRSLHQRSLDLVDLDEVGLAATADGDSAGQHDTVPVSGVAARRKGLRNDLQ